MAAQSVPRFTICAGMDEGTVGCSISFRLFHIHSTRCFSCFFFSMYT